MRPNKKSCPGVSVIICCYNSAKRLPETLKHLALQQVPVHIPWEVIIVNNASTDDTVEVAKKEWEQYQLSVSFKVVDQPKPGLSYARDKGFTTAQYEYCLFCDDDNWLDKEYIRIASEIMESDSIIGVLGGQGEAICDMEPPKWFADYKGAYAVGSQAEISGDITKIKGHVYGAGMIVRKSAYNRVVELKFCSILTGRKGSKLSSGEDTELCFALVLSGYKIYYDSNLKFKHFIAAHRLKVSYLKNLISSIGSSWVLLHPYLYAIERKKYDTFTWHKDVVYVFWSMVVSFINLFNSYTRKREFLLKAQISCLSRVKAFYIILANSKIYHTKISELLKQ